MCGFYAEDHLYSFFKYDSRVRLRMHETRKVVKVQNVSEPLTADRVSGLLIPLLCMGLKS